MKDTGQSLHYVLWKISRANLQMMIADAPSYKYKTKEEQEVIRDTGKNLAARVRARNANKPK